MGIVQTESIADDDITFTQLMQIFFDRVVNILEKGENADYQHFLLSSTIFSKGLSLKVV